PAPASPLTAGGPLWVPVKLTIMHGAACAGMRSRPQPSANTNLTKPDKEPISRAPVCLLEAKGMADLI
ncbi:MAG: hypothetical protein EB110_08515, partial [Betaproteobacteria bacterium]|nr:hypothetical protein [Betaproteobacteria bacterium]